MNAATRNFRLEYKFTDCLNTKVRLYSTIQLKLTPLDICPYNDSSKLFSLFEKSLKTPAKKNGNEENKLCRTSKINVSLFK